MMHKVYELIDIGSVAMGVARELYNIALEKVVDSFNWLYSRIVRY